MRVYLCGPMRGKPDWNWDAFRSAKNRWEATGHTALSPAVLGFHLGYFCGKTSGDDPAHLRHVLLSDILAIGTCDALAVLPGWEGSMGSTVEVAAAQFFGLPIYDAETMQEIKPHPKPWSWIRSDYEGPDGDPWKVAAERQMGRERLAGGGF